MAEDDTERRDDMSAEREAESEDELDWIDCNPDEIDDRDDAVGGQSAPRRDATSDEGE